jgi:alanine dehydrogenase
VVILGGGVVGTNAAKVAAGLGGKVVVLDLSLERLRYLADVMPANVQLVHSNRHNILEQISTCDLVIGGRADSRRQGAEAGATRRSQAHAPGRGHR